MSTGAEEKPESLFGGTKIERSWIPDKHTTTVMATEAMNESWRRIRDQIKEIWEEADFDDKQMKRARGEMDKIVGLIHDKTGESREEIRRKMSAIL